MKPQRNRLFGGRRASLESTLEPAQDWRTTGEHVVQRRRERARSGQFRVINEAPDHPVFSDFRVRSGSGQTYRVEVRGLGLGEAYCSGVDFRASG